MGKPEGKRKLGRPRHRWEDNIKMDLLKVEWGMDWIDVAQNRGGGGFLCIRNEPSVSIKCGEFLD